MSEFDSSHVRVLKGELKALKLKFKQHPDNVLLNRISELEGLIAAEKEEQAWEETRKIMKRITGR